MPAFFPEPPDQPAGGLIDRLIRAKVARVIGHSGFLASDQEDLEQELRLLIVRRASHYDPARACWNTFVVTIVVRHVRTLLTQRSRAKRCPDRQLLSLDELLATDGEEKGCTIVSRLMWDPTEQIDRALDVQEVLAQLPSRHRDLCRRLMYESIAEVARSLSIPRTTFSERIHVLRKALGAVAENN